MYSNILQSAKTVSQREMLISEIDRLITSLFKTNEEDFNKALSAIRTETAQLIRDEFLNKNNPSREGIKNFLSEQKAKLEKLRKIQLTIAISLSERLIGRIYDWIIKNIGDGYILDIEVNESILGGAAITFEGRYIDLSLKKSLDEVFSTNKKEIMSFCQKIE